MRQVARQGMMSVSEVLENLKPASECEGHRRVLAALKVCVGMKSWTGVASWLEWTGPLVKAPLESINQRGDRVRQIYSIPPKMSRMGGRVGRPSERREGSLY